MSTSGWQPVRQQQSAVVSAEPQSYWQHLGATRNDQVDDDRHWPSKADVVIVGGGFAGLMTAICLAQAEPDAYIVLLEAKFAGFGASGRNAGMLSPLAAPIWLVTADANAEHAWALKYLNTRTHAVAEWLKTKVPISETEPARLRIESGGRLTASALSRIATTLEKCEVAHSLSEANPTACEGLTVRPGASRVSLELSSSIINPYATVRALALAAQQIGVDVREHAAVEAVSETPTGVEIRSAGGQTIEARKAIICTNAYTRSVNLPTKARAKVVSNFMLATPRLRPEQLGALPAGNTFTVQLNRAYVFYRQHDDHLVFGGIEKFSQAGDNDFHVPTDVLAALERHMKASFPSTQFDVAECWGGRFHMTSTDLPQIERTGSNGSIVMNVGYGGTGVALSLVCARIAAALATRAGIIDPDDCRLHAAIAATRIPVLAGMRFGINVAAKALSAPFRTAH